MSARAGDRNELENLLKKTTPDLRRFAHQVCRTGADAEDAVQHVLVNVSLRVDGLEGIQRFTSWAFAVIRNECTRALSVATKWLRSTPPEPEAAPDPHRQAESRELLELVVEAIRELPAPLREVLVLLRARRGRYGQLRGPTRPLGGERESAAPPRAIAAERTSREVLHRALTHN